ncbi:MAG TPA: glycine betaine ABC transporter substrate-binding protein, partial [Gemmatimonadaceae bacterium]|nr:glycine betaine ABC transporter substrate-binding protein [Gemmatimonadaceae bacterium]
MRLRSRIGVLVIAAIIAVGASPASLDAQRQNRPVVVASKPFGESYLLAEMFSQLLESRGFSVDRKPGL